MVLKTFIDFILHIDKYLSILIANFGAWSYVILFIIIFLETGLVLTPFLPGDSLIFTVGTFAAIGSFNVYLMFILLTAAAIIGDTMNYWIGHYFGVKIFKKSKLFKKEYLDKTNKFYDKHGGKTIILARFIPIIRTFAPFVAGIGKMHYTRFLMYNVVGAILWVGIFLFSGFFLGNIPFVKENFTYVVLGIIVISFIPPVYHIIKHKLHK